MKGTRSSRSILTEENRPVPFTRKFFPVFPYKRKALKVINNLVPRALFSGQGQGKHPGDEVGLSKKVRDTL